MDLPGAVGDSLGGEMERQAQDGSVVGQTGRKPRVLRAQLSSLHRADGSVALQQGDTVVLAGVHGPGDANASRRLNDRAYLDVLFKSKTMAPLDTSTDNDQLVPLLRGATQSVVDTRKYPRSLIQLVIQELHDDGSLGAAALTAACLALVDAGVPLSGVFCGVCVALCADQTLVVDPCIQVQKSAMAVFTFALQSCNGTIEMISCDSIGRFRFDQFRMALDLAIQAADTIFMFYRETLQRKLIIAA